MTRADIIAMANDAREIVAMMAALKPGASVPVSVARKGTTFRAQRILVKCEAALAAQASGHEPMVELFGDAPTAQEGRE